MATRPTRNTARLAAILDNLPDGLLLVDESGTVINANARAVAAFGVSSASSLVGSSLGELLPSLAGSDGSPAGWPTVGESRRVLARPPIGDAFGVEVTCSRVPWGSGEERLLVSLRHGTDSTAEAELVRTGRAAQAVLRSTEEAICGVDRDGRVVLANPAAARLLGAKVSTIAGLDLHTMALHTRLDGTMYPSSESPIARTLRTGRRMQRRHEIVWRQDGSPVPVELSSAPMRDGSEIVGAVIAFTDITEQVESERRRARLVEVLVDEVAPALATLTAEADHAEALAKLREVVAEAIDYEHLMTGEAEIDLTEAQLSDIVEAALTAVRPLVSKLGVQMRRTVEPAQVVGDATRLTRTLTELLRAAAHAVDAGTVLTVEAKAGAETVRIAVTGLTEPADRPRDNPLLRWLRPGKVRDRGPDPDLALVQMVAEGHGGQFLLEVAADGSRAFVMELPTTPPAATTRGARRHARGETAPLEEAAAAAVEQAEAVLSVEEPTSAVEAPAEPEQVVAEGGTVIPMPARAPDAPGEATANGHAEAGAVLAKSTNGAAPAAVVEPAAVEVTRRRAAQVLVWPRPTEDLAAALSARGASSLALDKPEQPTVAVPDGAGVVLIDPVAGRLGRRTLHDLSKVAGSAGVPLVLLIGLGEVETEEEQVDPAVLVRPAAPNAGETLRVLLIEPGKVLAAALRASLRRAGHKVVHAVDDTAAAAAVGDKMPDLILRNLAGGAPDMPDQAEMPLWSGPDMKAPLPVIAYTSDDLTPGHEERLPAGVTLLSLVPRNESAAVSLRITGLVLRLADAD